MGRHSVPESLNEVTDMAMRNERDELRRDLQKIMDIFECWENTPQPDIEQLCEFIQSDRDDALEHQECSITCELCGERLADTDCEHCHGSGCGPGTASGAYEECEWCAGAGRIHPGCVEKSYVELAAENARLAVEVAKLQMPVGNLEIINGEAGKSRRKDETMITIPPEATAAAARRLGLIDTGDLEAALTAVLPHIEAAMREQVAGEIATSVPYNFELMSDGTEDHDSAIYAEALRDAVQIARGETHV